MREHRSRPGPQATFADGHQSIPALKVPKTEEAIAAIVRDERAEEEWKQIERAAKAEHVAWALAKLRSQSR